MRPTSTTTDDFVEDELGWGMTFRGSGRDPVARADDRPTLAGVLADHLGEEVQVLDVVEETWPAYDHVNVQTTCPGPISPAVPRERYAAPCARVSASSRTPVCTPL